MLDGDASRRNAFARPPRPRARLAPPRPALAFPLVDAHRALVIARSFITARLSSTKRADQFNGSSGDLVNVAIVVFFVFVFLQYVAGANGLFGQFGVFSNW